MIVKNVPLDISTPLIISKENKERSIIMLFLMSVLVIVKHVLKIVFVLKTVIQNVMLVDI